MKELGKRERRIVLRILKIALAALCVVAIAIFFYLIPFRKLLAPISMPARVEDEMRVHFLDVGEGDCTVVEFPDGDALVVDAGDGSFEHVEHIVRFLKGIGSPRLTLVATHADADHCGGFKEILQLFEVDLLYLPLIGSPNHVYTDMVDEANKRGVATETLSRYGTIERPSGAYAVCINPRGGETEDNEASAVLYVSYGGVNLLLGADIGAEREELLLAEYALDESIFDREGCRVRLGDVDILRVSHHGSAQSSSEAWLSLLDAEVAVISCGRDNIYSHPAEEAIKRLSRYSDEIYRTDECGDVTACVWGGTYAVFTASEFTI